MAVGHGLRYGGGLALGDVRAGGSLVAGVAVGRAVAAIRFSGRSADHVGLPGLGRADGRLPAAGLAKPVCNQRRALVGLFRPAILLPEEESAAASSREILVHELAHLARHDLLWKLLGRVGTAMFFFQPLLWLLLRRMVVAAEEVCDDHVLEFGCDRGGYARQLVEVAQRTSRPNRSGWG